MEVAVLLDFYGFETTDREALRAFCERQVRRALHGDRHDVARVLVTLRRDPVVAIGQRWTARIELHMKRARAVPISVTAMALRPHGAVDDAALTLWSALHASDALAVG